MTLQEFTNFFYLGVIGRYEPDRIKCVMNVHPTIINFVDGKFIEQPHKYSWRMLSVEDAKNILAHNKNMNKLRDKIELIIQKKLEIGKDFKC